MKVFFAFLLLLSGPLLASAETWESFVVTTTGTGYLDEKTVKSSGAKRQVWMRFVSRQTKQSSTSLVELDCSANTVRFLYQIQYGPDDSELRRITKPEEKAQPIVPYSTDASLVDRVCNPRKKQ